MKLSTYDDGTRDGRLMLVSRDGTKCIEAPVPTLQVALDDWARAEPVLRAAETGLATAGQAFVPARCLAPLPRAYQWVDGSAYVNHVELVRRARGAELPASFWTDPLVYQGGSDDFARPVADVPFVDTAHGIDLEGEIAVVTDDVPIGTDAGKAAGRVRLLMLVNDWSLRNLIPGELAKGFGFYQSKPATGFGPIAVTPDELSPAWDGARVHLRLRSWINGAPFGEPDAGRDMVFGFPELIAHAARTRRLGAGAILGSGTVSNMVDGKPARPIAEGGPGYSCLAEVRMIETIDDGAPRTPFLTFGDRVRIEMLDADGTSVFGAIEQTVVRA